MATKLDKNAFPQGHDENAFEAFGPVVSEDTKFSGCRLADLGCFKQEGVDSNKYYHLAVVKSKINGKWYAYFEWGRTRPDGRPTSPAFQFHECSSEQEAATICEKQFNDKNTKRGVWEKIGSKQRLVPKPKKSKAPDGSALTEDLYIVRPTAKRLVGLPCAENITNEDAKGNGSKAVSPVVVKTNGGKKARTLDTPTHKLFADLLKGAVSYTKAVMSGGSGQATIPTQAAIDDARDILQDALARLLVVGQNVTAQVADRQLKLLTYQLYGRIPKAKPQGQPEAAWILTTNNIDNWTLDLDAFETALQADDMKIERETEQTDVMQGIPADVCWINPRDPVGEWLYRWLPATATDTNNFRGWRMTVHNLWKVDRHGDTPNFRKVQQQILKEMPRSWNNERPLFQEKNRTDLTAPERTLYWDTNTALTLHGTRSVNVPGIVREHFRLPKELVGITTNGAMFGPGIYQADTWQKSANYCSGPGAYYNSTEGGVKGRQSFMFLCDTICGVPYYCSEDHGFTSPPSGHHCVFGKAGHTRGWNGKLANNEWIVYRKDRTILRYLAEVSWRR